MSLDLALQLWVSGLVEMAKLRWMLGDGEPWKPGRPLRLLFAGYNGTRNTGSDVRVEEMLRQVRHILGPDQVELSVLSQNFELTRGYFDGARQVKLPDIFPPALYREVRRYDGVVAGEGSMFQSTFASALTTMMIEVLALASAQNKLSIGYGAEAGAMDPVLEWMCRRYLAGSLILTRNVESAARLWRLGIAAEAGTDTAWTFRPHPPDYAARALRAAGWDGRAPVLVVCPINPAWWPVKASLTKATVRALTGAYADSHYRSVYFHEAGRRVTEAYHRHLDALAGGIRRFRRERNVFPVLVAMEALDTRACRQLAERLGRPPVFSSLDYDMYQLVSILRRGHLMIASRYHAIVTSMPALVPSAGLAMDERIRNLMHERGHRHLLLTVDDPDLEDRIVEVLGALETEREAIRERLGRTVARHLELMARMGAHLEEHVKQRYPEFPIRAGASTWHDYLPPLGPDLRGLADRYAA